PLQGLRKVDTQVGQRATHGAEHARIGRYHHRADADLAHQRRAVQWPGAAESDEGEVARIVAALDREQTDAAGHALVDDLQDRLGRRLDAESQLLPEFAHCLTRALEVERLAIA